VLSDGWLHSLRYGGRIARLAVTLALLGALLTLAACGQSDEGSGSPAPEPPPAGEVTSSDAGEGGPAETSPEAGSPDGAPLSREDFVDEANAICEEATRSIEELAAPASLSDLALRVPELQDIAQRELDKLRALGPPADAAERLDPTYFALLERQLALLQDLGEAASANDLVGARDVLSEAATLNVAAAQIATDYGLEQCTDTSDVADAVGDEPAPEPLSTTEAFVAAADVVCTESRELVERLREPQTIEESAEILADIIDISSEELRRLGALEPPDALADRFAELLSLREQQIAALGRFREALLADDRDAVSEALFESSRINGETDALERDLGFQVCGIEPVQEVPNQRRLPSPQEQAEEPS